ncbi:MAG: propanediol utilization protein, partial [Pseudomonadota bacterium]
MHHGRRLPPQSLPPRKVALTGHFGEFLQGRLGAEGPVALVTLPCPVARAEVAFTPRAHAPLVASGPLAPLLRCAATAARGQGMRVLGGVLHLRHNVPPGGGAGLSTMAALGTIRALRGPSDAAPEAALCLAFEGATDPLMHAEPGRLLWASRQARIVETLPPPPRFTVAAGFLGPPLRTDPASTDFADIADLVDRWRRAAQAGDAPAAAAIATASAERNGRLTG